MLLVTFFGLVCVLSISEHGALDGLRHGVDSFGNVCGMDNSEHSGHRDNNKVAFGGPSFSTEDNIGLNLVAQPYLFYFDAAAADGSRTKGGGDFHGPLRVCVASCPLADGSARSAPAAGLCLGDGSSSDNNDGDGDRGDNGRANGGADGADGSDRLARAAAGDGTDGTDAPASSLPTTLPSITTTTPTTPTTRTAPPMPSGSGELEGNDDDADADADFTFAESSGSAYNDDDEGTAANTASSVSPTPTSVTSTATFSSTTTETTSLTSTTASVGSSDGNENDDVGTSFPPESSALPSVATTVSITTAPLASTPTVGATIATTVASNSITSGDFSLVVDDITGVSVGDRPVTSLSLSPFTSC